MWSDVTAQSGWRILTGTLSFVCQAIYIIISIYIINYSDAASKSLTFLIALTWIKCSLAQLDE